MFFTPLGSGLGLKLKEKPLWDLKGVSGDTRSGVLGRALKKFPFFDGALAAAPPRAAPTPRCGHIVPKKSAVVWRKVLLVFLMIFELGPYSEPLLIVLPSESIRCGVKAFFHPKN